VINYLILRYECRIAGKCEVFSLIDCLLFENYFSHLLNVLDFAHQSIFYFDYESKKVRQFSIFYFPKNLLFSV